MSKRRQNPRFIPREVAAGREANAWDIPSGEPFQRQHGRFVAGPRQRLAEPVVGEEFAGVFILPSVARQCLRLIEGDVLVGLLDPADEIGDPRLPRFVRHAADGKPGDQRDHESPGNGHTSAIARHFRSDPLRVEHFAVDAVPHDEPAWVRRIGGEQTAEFQFDAGAVLRRVRDDFVVPGAAIHAEDAAFQPRVGGLIARRLIQFSNPAHRDVLEMGFGAPRAGSEERLTDRIVDKPGPIVRAFRRGPFLKRLRQLGHDFLGQKRMAVGPVEHAFQGGMSG